MSTDEFIDAAIKAGQSRGVGPLEATQRLVYLIAEAEADCDMNGIDAFLGHYAPAWLGETAAAFEAVGAAEIADSLRGIAVGHPPSEAALYRANELITGRVGYSYEAIRAAVEARLTSRCSGPGHAGTL
jgi:hypothetical protein